MRTSRSGRSACSVRCAWTTRRLSAPFASAAYELSRFVEDVYADRVASERRRRLERHPRWHDMSPMSTTERDYYELLGVPRNADEQAIKKAFRRLARELHPDVSDAPDAEVRFREVTEAYEALSNPETRQLYDRYGHAGLRSGGFQPTSFDLGSFGDLFSAFFGDDLFGGSRRGRGGSAAAPTSSQRSRSTLAEAAQGHQGRGAARAGRPSARRATATAQRRARPSSTCPRCNGGGVVQQVSRSIFGEFVRQSACPECYGTGRRIEQPCETCDGAGRTRRGADARGRHPRRASTTASGSASPAKAMRARLGGRAGDAYVRSSRAPRRRGSCARATTSSRRSTSRSSRPRSARTSPVETIDGTERARVRAGHTARRGARAARQGDAGAPGLRPRRPPRPRQRHRPAPLTHEQRRLLEEFEQLSDDDTYHHDEGFFEKLKSAFH